MKTKKIVGIAVILSFLISISMMASIPSVFALPYKFAAQPTITDTTNDIIKINSSTQAILGLSQTYNGLDVSQIQISGQTINVTFLADVAENATFYMMIDCDNDDTGNFTIAFAYHTLASKAVLYKGHYDANLGSEEYWNTSNGWSTGLGNSADIGDNNTKFINITIPSAAYTIQPADEFVVYIFDSLSESGVTYIDYAPDYTLGDLFPIPGFEIVIIIVALSAIMGLFLWRKNRINIST